MRKVLVTGANGFIGSNLVSALELRGDTSVIKFGRSSTVEDLRSALQEVDFVFHLAGVNRPESEGEFQKFNTDLTGRIVQILRESELTTPVLFSSSVQADRDNPYGKSKLAAEEILYKWNEESGAAVAIYRLPGVFGKWCRPNYNSVVATFCHNIARGLPISISDPEAPLSLVYIDDVVQEFESSMEVMSRGIYQRNIAPVFNLTLRELVRRIEAIKAMRSSLILPDMGDGLNKRLYATFTSYLQESDFAYPLLKHEDNRGFLAEFVKSPSAGQIFVSRTLPGVSRGNHWHKTKVEKFLVVSGTAEITFRRIGDGEIIRYRVRGDEMRVVDIPVGYVHAITNVGNDELTTLFWASEVLDQDSPDTYYEPVEM